MASTQIPLMLSNAIADITKQTMHSCASVLAEKYGFPPDEAKRFLDSKKELASPVLTSDKATKGKGKAKATKTTLDDAAADSTKPKASRLTGYLLFSKAERPAITTALTKELEDGKKLKPQKIITEQGARWKALDQKTKDEWNDKAKHPVVTEASYSE